MNQLATAETAPTTELVQPQDMTASALALDERVFARVMALAEVMASAKATIPTHLRGSKGDCAAVIMQAFRWRMDPFAVALKTHLVQGTLGYEAQLVNAAINTMAPTKDRLHFEWFGNWKKIIGKFVERESRTKKDDEGEAKKYRAPAWKIEDEEGLGVKVWATLKGENEPRELELLLTQARTRNSTLWADDPKQQLAYLATKRWSRLYCPDVILGVYTPDEINETAPPKDMGVAEVVEKKAALSANVVDLWKEACARGTKSARSFWQTLSEDERRAAIAAGTDREMWEAAVAADKSRTVDNPAEGETKPSSGGTETPSAETKPAAGETQAGTADTAAFVAAMDRAEQTPQK